MAKFRKKPIEVEAEQWFPDRIVAGVCGKLDAPGMEMHRPHVHTIEGPLNVSRGDWIVTGVKSEKYPVKPDVFEATYEPVV